MAIDPALRKRLITAFLTDLEEQRQVIVDGLLAIENSTGEEELKASFAAVMRAAHNIKGAARGIGFLDVATITHHLETLFSSISQAPGKASPEIYDRVLAFVDQCWEVARADAEERQSSVDVDEILDQLSDAITSCGGTPPARQRDARPASGPKPGDGRAAASPEAPAEPDPGANEPAIEKRGVGAAQKGDIVRVTAAKLDGISALLEELQITKIELDDHVGAMRRFRVREADRIDRLRYSSVRAAVGSGGNAALALPGFATEDSDLHDELNALYQDVRARANRLDIVLKSLQAEVHDLRLVAANVMLAPLKRSVRDIARELDKKIEFSVEGEEIEADKAVFEKLRDPLVHIIRNAIDHGIESPERRVKAGKPETGKIAVRVSTESGELIVQVRDDGAGVDLSAVRAVAVRRKLLTKDEADALTADDLLHVISRPGYSSKENVSDISGRGVGMDAVQVGLQQIKGTISLETVPGEGSTFTVRVPISLATEHALLVEAGGQLFALAVTAIERVMNAPASSIVDVEAGQAIVVGDESVPVRNLAGLLKLEQPEIQARDNYPVVVLRSGWQMLALVVTRILGQQEMVIAPLKPPLLSVRNVAGGTFTGRHGIVVVLKPSDLVESAMHEGSGTRAFVRREDDAPDEARRVLVADDSLTTRTLEKNILENHGFDVTVAVNGEEAWSILKREPFDLVVSDVEMPVLDGFELTRRIRGDDKLKDTPVVLVTSLDSDDDRQRGVDAGADAYVVKGEFETRALIDIVNRLI